VTRASIFRNVFFVLLGVTALVLKSHYSGSFREIVYSYGGNVSVSFAVYFIILISMFGQRFGRLATAGIAIFVLELFEVTNGFGVMTNVYDQFDLVANAMGVGLALAIDTAVSKINKQKMSRCEPIASKTAE
jgi:hypothetical protein